MLLHRHTSTSNAQPTREHAVCRGLPAQRKEAALFCQRMEATMNAGAFDPASHPAALPAGRKAQLDEQQEAQEKLLPAFIS